MIGALFYVQYNSVKNRTVMRIKRLRQPKYLMGALAGGLYFYFYFFRWVFGMRSGRPGWMSAITPEDLALYQSFGALIFFGLVFLAWIIPHERAALAFTEAEVAFLFPAPVSRRGLIHFKLIRSQMAILVTTIVLTLVTNRLGGLTWVRAAGWWLVLSTLNLHFIGSSFARTLLMNRGITNGRRRALVLACFLGLTLWVILWARASLPPLTISPLADLTGF